MLDAVAEPVFPIVLVYELFMNLLFGLYAPRYPMVSWLGEARLAQL